jgi:hypothetical protein
MEGRMTAPDWTRKRGRIYWYDQYALNEQTTAFTKYDPDRAVDDICGTGADIVVVYATNQWGVAYYPSAVWPQHPGLHGRDYVGDLVERFHARSKKVILYTNWLDSKHAEWQVLPVGEEDEPSHREQPLASWADPALPNGRVQAIEGGKWRFPCLNSPAREQMAAVTREIVDRYQPDGFSLDMLLWPAVCGCKFCRPVLERVCGTKEVTREAVAAHWPAYIDWASERSSSIVAELTAILREHGVLAVHNAMFPLWMSSGYGVSEEWLPSIDVYVSEIFSDLHAAGMSVRLHHALGMPSWMLRTSTQPHFGHWPIPVAQWQLCAAACKANGCDVLGPCGIGAYPDTTSAHRLLGNVKTGLDSFMQDADLAEEAISAARVGLVFSWATRRYHGQGSLDWSDELRGWSRVLIEEHIPFDLVVAERAGSARDLHRYDLLILPNTACLPESFCAVLREYARDGGRLLVTAESSLWDEHGAERSDFALGDVLGVSRRGVCNGPFALERHGEPEPAAGQFQQVTARGAVLSRRVQVDPAGSVVGFQDPLPLQLGEWPAAVRNRFGQGQAVYVAFDVGRFYSAYADEHIAEWMAELVDGLLPARQITVRGPRSVEITLWAQESPRRLVIHLAQQTQYPDDMRRVTEIVPIPLVDLTLPVPGPNPHVSARHASVASSVTDGSLRIELRDIGAYAAAVVEY